mmetsp:Transcript_34567/g.25698  ORF Transcript_34567/g.25698 Transcript_34567/m.25698 type:complete len:85 (-) Transcript_34567:132-386(-)
MPALAAQTHHFKLRSNEKPHLAKESLLETPSHLIGSSSNVNAWEMLNELQTDEDKSVDRLENSATSLKKHLKKESGLRLGLKAL